MHDHPSVLTPDQFERLLAEVRRALAAPAPAECYEVEQFAQLVGLSPYTVRNHLRAKRLNGTKKFHGRGKHRRWVLTHEELLRYRREGLVPPPTDPLTQKRA